MCDLQTSYNRMETFYFIWHLITYFHRLGSLQRPQDDVPREGVLWEAWAGAAQRGPGPSWHWANYIQTTKGAQQGGTKAAVPQIPAVCFQLCFVCEYDEYLLININLVSLSLPMEGKKRNWNWTFTLSLDIVSCRLAGHNPYLKEYIYRCTGTFST